MLLATALLSALSALSAPALACPTIATGTPNELTYDVARTTLVRQGTRTTFTVSVAPEGQSQDFALVLPVPEVLAEGDIAVLDNEVFARLDAYTGLLTMPDAGCAPGGGTDSSDGAGGGGGGGGGSVQVEAQYLVGGYEITILSATESGSLFSWLDDNGYHLAEATIPVLEDYIAEGLYFLTARVHDEATTADGSALPPLQVAYDADVFTVPIRLAARNSSGEQDMLIYAVTDYDDGLVGVSNYPEFDIPDTCIWGDPEEDDFGAFYEDRFRPLWAAEGEAAWTVEWAGAWGDCSPCSGTGITAEDLDAIGFEGEPGGHFLTRIHMRYTPATATQDLMLYSSNRAEPKVTSYADDNDWNRDCIDPCEPVGDSGGGSDGGSGGGDGSDGAAGGGSDDPVAGGTEQDAPGDDSKGGCHTVSAGSTSLIAGLLSLGLVARRRA